MTEEQSTEIQKEGEPAFPTLDTENENSAASSPGEETTEGTEETTEESTETTEESTEETKGETKETKKEDVPFNKHPDWIKREKTLNDRFNDQEERHQNDLKELRTEFGKTRKDDTEQKEIPDWFGSDDPKQWGAFLKDRDADMKAAEDRAYARISKDKESGDDAVKKATDYMNDELATIQSDKTLNPTGAKVDPNEIVKIAIDNELVDTKGRWNYKAAWKIKQNKPAPKKVDTSDKKELAGAVTSESKGETKTPEYKTGDDFKGSKAIW